MMKWLKLIVLMVYSVFTFWLSFLRKVFFFFHEKQLTILHDNIVHFPLMLALLSGTKLELLVLRDQFSRIPWIVS